jgi:preprotein translocase subunit SecY
MWSTFVNAWRSKDVRQKLLFTLFILVIYRFGSVAILIPGIDTDGLRLLFDQYSESGNLLGYFNVLSGGALSYATLFALSITPYINASIIIQLLTVAIPALERLSRDGGEEGKKKLAAITRYSTVVIGLIQSFTYYILLKNNNLLTETGVWQAIVIIASFTAGSAIVMWLGEKITEKGIGNGISMILFAGILSRIPSLVRYIIGYISMGGWYILGMVGLVVGVLAMIVFIVYMTDGERRIPIQYAKRMVGRKMYGGQATNLPMKVNMSGVLPVIFASTLLSLPSTIIGFTQPREGGFWDGVGKVFTSTHPVYIILYILFIVAFGYFYAMIQFNPVEVANNIKKNGGFVTGYRPGKPTSDYLTRIEHKITFIGSSFLVIIAALPLIFGAITGMTNIAIGGTSLMIAVGVAIEFYEQIETQLMMRHYKGFLE